MVWLGALASWPYTASSGPHRYCRVGSSEGNLLSVATCPSPPVSPSSLSLSLLPLCSLSLLSSCFSFICISFVTRNGCSSSQERSTSLAALGLWVPELLCLPLHPPCTLFVH